MIHCDNVSLTLWYIVIAICCWTDIDCEKSFARCMIHVYRCRDQSQEWYFGDISKGSTDISLNYRCNMLLIKLCDISLKFHWYITRAKRDIQRLLFALLFTNTVAFLENNVKVYIILAISQSYSHWFIYNIYHNLYCRCFKVITI